ncbi:YqgE/AlgH family protein [uncultured Flavobacterium sp.]|uniref:YqgE/AlgH family protein n=1 Tax=uncultured Flavobacterium sp. TaxID=165435 RepID=UPI0030CA1FB9
MNKIKKGQLLVSEPALIGENTFNRSVVLLAAYSNDGVVGFILNKPLLYSIHDLLPEINSNFTIYDGGPVEQDNLYFVHTVPLKIKNSLEISNGLFWGGDFELLKVLLNENQISKTEIRFFLGYSGWSKGQLEMECDQKNWLIIDNKEHTTLFSKPAKKFWKEKIEAQGGDYILFSNAPENPILN